MQKKQRAFTREFKEEAVHLANTSGKPMIQIARELGIADSTCVTGVRSFPSTERRLFQEAVTRLHKRKKSDT